MLEMTWRAGDAWIVSIEYNVKTALLITATIIYESITIAAMKEPIAYLLLLLYIKQRASS